MDNIFDKLKSIVDNVKVNEDMGKHTSFKTGGIARYYVACKTLDEILQVLSIVKENKLKLFVLGNGTNVLFKEGLFDGVVLKIEFDMFYVNDDGLISIGAGLKNAFVAQKLLDESLTGFEFAAGIPGTIGGSIRMNAGAFGGEFKDIVQSITYINYDTLELENISNVSCDFSYRHSVFADNKNIILFGIFRFDKFNKLDIKLKMDEYKEIRREKQPLEYPSCGSTFKRGEGFITAQLIDECGLKGYRIGGAEVSSKHAGFIINKDNASPNDIIELIEYVKKVVFEKTGNKIELEIEIV